MKMLLSLAALLFSLNSNANVKPHGTVVNSRCGKAVESPVRAGGYQLSRICLARVTGHKDEYFAVDEVMFGRGGARKQTTLWEITGGVENAMSMVYTLTESGFKDEKGMYQPKASTGHITGKIRISLTADGSMYKNMTGELGGRKFKATDFKDVFTTL